MKMQVLSRKLMLFGGEPTIWCDGCQDLHRLAVNQPNPHNGHSWTWNGETVTATFHPSLNITIGPDPEGEPLGSRGEPLLICHTWIRNGQIEYLGDCTHELRGQTVEIPDLPARYIRETVFDNPQGS